jgi:N-acetylglutamate synthase-like GNAT family acetyltransferase
VDSQDSRVSSPTVTEGPVSKLALPDGRASDTSTHDKVNHNLEYHWLIEVSAFYRLAIWIKSARLQIAMNVQIRRAIPDEAGVLTEIAHAAKRHWGYPENWIRQWESDLTITPEFIAKNEMYVAMNGEEIVGCCALAFSESCAELEHMWIRPDHMGGGIGRAMFLHVKERAANLEIPALEISADPNAEGFYKRMGATRIGELRSEIEGEPRVLPRMVVVIGSE